MDKGLNLLGSFTPFVGGYALPTTTAEEALRTDDSVAGSTFIGRALIGTADSAAAWKISFLDETNVSGSVAILKWADGNANYDNIWDNRTSLSYS